MSMLAILEQLSISKEIINKFKEMGMTTVIDFMSCSCADLEKKFSLSSNLIESLKDVIYTQHAVVSVSGTNLYEETLRQTKIISTGETAEINNGSSLDNLLDGGFFTKELTEIYGPPASGKTQVAYTVVSNVISNLQLNVLFIDTCGSFTYDRLKEILYGNMENSSPKTFKSYLSRLDCHKVFDAYHLIADLECLREKLSSESDDFCTHLKLLVIDNLPAVISPVLGGELREGHALLSYIGLLLKEIAYENGIAVLVINNAVSNYFDQKKNPGVISSNKYKPTLGVTWQSVPAIRLFIDMPDKCPISMDVRNVVIEKHIRMPANQMTRVKVSMLGVCNASEIILAGYTNGSIAVFDTCAPRAKRILPVVASCNRTSRGNIQYSTDAVQWYPHDTGIFLTLSADRVVRAWDTNEMEVAESFKFKHDVFSFHLSKKAKRRSLIAVGCQDKCIYLCDLKSGSKSHTLKGHSGLVYCVQWSPRNENILISGSSDGELFIWDVRKAKPYMDSLKCLQTKAHNGRVNGLQFTPDGLHLITFATDDRVRLWDLSTFEIMKIDYGLVENTSRRIVKLAYTRDLPNNLTYIPSGVYIKVFEILTGRSYGILAGHFQNVNACCFAPARQELYTCAADSQIIQWSCPKKESITDSELMEDSWSDIEDL